jgi:hypothetical protein
LVRAGGKKKFAVHQWKNAQQTKKILSLSENKIRKLEQEEMRRQTYPWSCHERWSSTHPRHGSGYALQDFRQSTNTAVSGN